MNNDSTFPVAHLRTHEDEFIAVVRASNDVAATAETRLPLTVLQDMCSLESLLRAMNILEKLAAERADAIQGQRAEISDVLEHLRVVH